MLHIRPVNNRFAVAPQIAPEDLPAIRAAGYVAVINNRPDEEEAGLLAAHNKDDSDSSDDSDDDNDDGNMLAVGGTPKPGSPSYVDESRPNRTGQ